MKKFNLIILVVLLATSCKEPLSREQTNNEDYKISLLFEIDGCKVYRFYDMLEWRYFVVQDGRASVSWYDDKGKNDRVHQQIQTITKTTTEGK